MLLTVSALRLASAPPTVLDAAYAQSATSEISGMTSKTRIVERIVC